MNGTLYANTVKKILKHKFVLMILFLSIFMVPVGSIEHTPLLKTASIRDSYLVSFVLSMLIVTLTSPFPATISMSSRMDYMPLIVTRPIPRWKYVCSKWLALATVIGSTLLLQQVVSFLVSLMQPLHITPSMYLCDSIDRILIALSLTSVITFVYLLPTELSILAGVVAIQIGAATHILPLSFGFLLLYPLTQLQTMSSKYLKCVPGCKKKYSRFYWAAIWATVLIIMPTPLELLLNLLLLTYTHTIYFMPDRYKLVLLLNYCQTSQLPYS